jgi:hypothetical protein
MGKFVGERKPLSYRWTECIQLDDKLVARSKDSPFERQFLPHDLADAEPCADRLKAFPRLAMTRDK